LYEISVTVPAAGVSLAERVPYHLLHHFGVDTVYVDQSSVQGGWCVLGKKHYKAKGFASVMVSNKATSGMVAADAMRVRRVLATAVADAPPRSRVQGPQLLGSYPNPCNGATNIAFSLPVSGYGMIKVYNVLGQEVDTVTTHHLPAGVHKLRLDLQRHPRGLYLCRLFCVTEAGETLPGAVTRKLVILR
jgi:hypothetical protein